MPQHQRDTREASWIRIVVATDFATWMSWTEARRLNPQAMEHALVLHATVHGDGSVDVTLEVSEDHIEYLKSAVGKEFALSALEASLTEDAFEIIHAANLEDALQLIPSTDLVPPFEANTFAVTWSADDAVMIYDAIQRSEDDLRHVTLVRMGRDENGLLLAVRLPPGLADEVRAEGVAKREAGFPDGVQAKLVSLINTEPDDPSDDAPVRWPDDGDMAKGRPGRHLPQFLPEAGRCSTKSNGGHHEQDHTKEGLRGIGGGSSSDRRCDYTGTINGTGHQDDTDDRRT